MKRTLAAAAIALAMSSGVMLATSTAQAQNAERVYDNGTVWTISQIETKPGMFDDYMKYLSSTWRQIQEADKKAGYVVSYKVLTVESPRDHEPDVILMVEYKNMAAFGSTTKASQAAVSRESLRVLRGSETARELKFIK